MQATVELETPLWTADASKQTRRAVGTGLIGSLRWWYESLVRGLGGWACDPTDADARCPPRNATVTPENVSAVLCPACQLFGATGWAKTFTLAVTDHTQPDYPPTGRGTVQTTGGRLNRRGKPSAWYFDRGRVGPLTLTLLPRRPDDTGTVSLLFGLLEFIRRNAALGAKTGLGYGLFTWETPPPGLPAADDWVEMLAARASTGRRGPNGRWPDLRQMFFATVNLGESWTFSDFANFKYDLRAAFRDNGISSTARHFLLGSTHTDPNQATKIKMALLPDKRTLRLWGWLPNRLPGGLSRRRAMRLLRGQFEKAGSITRWQTFGAARDTPQAYLKSLYGGVR